MNIKMLVITFFSLNFSFISAGNIESISGTLNLESTLEKHGLSKHVRVEPFKVDSNCPEEIRDKLQTLLNWYKKYLKDISEKKEVNSSIIERDTKTTANQVQDRLLAFNGQKNIAFLESEITPINICIALIHGITIKCFLEKRWIPLIEDIVKRVQNFTKEIEKKKLKGKKLSLCISHFIIATLLTMLPGVTKEDENRDAKRNCSYVALKMKYELYKIFEKKSL